MRISLTDLVDIVSKSGSPKATKVAQIKARPDYQPAIDFYKQFRDGIIGIHKSSGARTELAKIISKVSEKNRVSNYPAAIAGYKKWWGTKSLEWFQPQSKIFSRSGVDVSINPELGLDVPPVLSSTSVWSPIPHPKEIGREEAVYRRAD
ncbi:hypothetical protein, partial [Rhodanobacter sp. Root561]|uniref:hypothetical protein n=1 Tax=Rhodanobacter sp. Root561 TaxID=1736560 RepID=UPI0019100482